MSGVVRVRPRGYDFFATASAVMLVIFVIVAGLNFIAGFIELSMLNGVRRGAELEAAQVENLYLIRGGIEYLQDLAMWFCIVPVAVWIFKANVGARAIGATGMTYSPFASVAWFAVPLAYLWMPFRAMSQIWRASHDPVAWRETRVPTHVNAWWGCWVLYMLSNHALRVWSRSTTTLADLVGFNLLGQANLLFVLAAGMLLILVIGRLRGRQDEEYRRFDVAQTAALAGGELEPVLAARSY